jgi:hypothetical protein
MLVLLSRFAILILPVELDQILLVQENFCKSVCKYVRFEVFMVVKILALTYSSQAANSVPATMPTLWFRIPVHI